jgi:hypothetical protein
MEVMLGPALQEARRRKSQVNAGIKDRRKAALKESVVTTWRAIIRIVHRRLRAGTLAAVDGVVRIHLDNTMVAAAAGVSSRTVIRHRHKLEEAGLICGHTFRGSHSPYEMAIPAAALGLAEAVDPKAAAAELEALCARAEALEALAGGDKMSPHHEASSSSSIEENGECGNAAPRDGSGALAEAEREGSPTGSIGGKHGKQAASGGGGRSRHRQEEIRPARADLAESLWALAKVLLWPGSAHSPRQVAEARRHIAAIYAQVPDDGLQIWHGHFCGMVAAARRYIDGDPLNRFVVSPDMWFSPGFRHGFRATWPWHAAWEKQRQLRRADAAVEKAMRAWRRNELAPPSKRIEPLDLYKRLSEAVADHGVAASTDRWLHWISTTRLT